MRGGRGAQVCWSGQAFGSLWSGQGPPPFAVAELNGAARPLPKALAGGAEMPMGSLLWVRGTFL